ncbi:type VI secretion system ImpA family N-terminal domain-containing protein [Aurantimonas sp. 22II-16-19i]|uniref:type VI secretion system ImpA family N-terminal domain-containing protein n=1 Tax=Aurantimonas sp. 22II-16-19i TaxID=1317114 RepID=UPI001593671B|nr:type VI secretion system ImpA family N-terminal domain-containing protein [Aurantimonas sp. 22II-16-19i]
MVADETALLAPLSPDEPCGPDLVAAGDPQVLTFRDRIEALLPASFPGGRLTREDGLPFDVREIRLRDERAAIAALLARSRDLRLVLLEARLLLLAGDLPGLAGRIALAARLLDTHWESVHPQAAADRRSEFEAFEPPVAGPIPLQFVPILRDRRAGAIRFRDVMIAAGEARGPESETTLDEATIRAALADPANRAAVAATRDALLAIEDAIEAVKAAFAAHGAAGAAPRMQAFRAMAGRIAALIDEACGGPPDRRGQEAAGPAPGAAASAGPPPGLAALATIPIGHHDEAAAALLAAGRYFASSEPSSPSLLLVHQARALIGRPLMEALAVLAPERLAEASLGIDGAPGLALDLARLQALSDTAGGAADAGAGGRAPAGAGHGAPATMRFEAKNREAAAALIASVEAYFRLAEPSSPVPLLLARARGLIGRDFAALLPQLFPSLRRDAD